jgi:ABC-2 type transport system permease protein
MTPSTRQGTGSWTDSVRFVAGREIRQRVATRSFVWTTVALLLLIVAGTVAARFLTSTTESAVSLGLTPATAGLEGPVTSTAEALGISVDTTRTTEDDGRGLVLDDELDALLVGSDTEFTVVTRSELDDGLASALTVVAQQAELAQQVADLGGDPSAVSGAVGAVTLDVEALDPPQEVAGSQVLSGYVVGILLFIALQTCGQMVAQGVVEEKTSRVVELLLATVRPWQLMAGKVLGIGAIGLAQVVVLAGAGVATAAAVGLTDDIEVDLGATAGWAVAWFVVGFTMYALLYAALAALVSRQEEVASVTSPLLMVMMVPYVVGVSVAPWAPENPLVLWLSYLPFTSPLIMPIRVALGSVPDWHVYAVLALNAALVPVLVWFTGRIYSNAVLRTGSRVRIKDAFRAA